MSQTRRSTPFWDASHLDPMKFDVMLCISFEVPNADGCEHRFYFPLKDGRVTFQESSGGSTCDFLQTSSNFISLHHLFQTR